MAIIKGLFAEIAKVLKPATSSVAVAVEAVTASVAAAAIQGAVAVAPDEKDLEDYDLLTDKLRDIYKKRIESGD